MACLSMSLSLTCSVAPSLGPVSCLWRPAAWSRGMPISGLSLWAAAATPGTVPYLPGTGCSWDTFHHMAHCHCSGTCSICAAAATQGFTAFFFYHYTLCSRDEQVRKETLNRGSKASVSLAWSASVKHWEKQGYGMEMIIHMLQPRNSLVQWNAWLLLEF